MPSKSQPIRDLLYLDFDKAASIWSQFEEGLLERVVDYVQKRSTLQTRTLHHDLLHRVENQLSEVGLVADLDACEIPDETSAESIRQAIGPRPYLRASGHSVIEDYRRILAVAERFNEIVDSMSKAAQASLKATSAYQDLQKAIAEAREAAAKLPDRNRRAVEKQRAKELADHLDELVKPKLQGLDAWLVNGVRSWIDTFMAGRINSDLPVPKVSIIPSVV